MTPTKQVGIGAAMGALTVVLAWSMQTLGGVTVPAEIAVAVSTLLTFGAQYWIGPNA